MKSSYELLSIFLDKQPLPSQLPKIVDQSEVPQCADIEDDYNLFDLPICRRKISGLKLLSAVSPENIMDFVGKLVDCQEIYIILDYHSVSTIACQLFMKRILQAMYLLMCKYPKTNFVLVSDEQELTNVLNRIYG